MVAADRLVVPPLPKLVQVGRLDREGHGLVRNKGVEGFGAAVLIADKGADREDKVVGCVSALIKRRQKAQTAGVFVDFRIRCFAENELDIAGDVADRDGHEGPAVLILYFLSDAPALP